ncbi:MAG: ACT domain-containing protein [Planctomycetes bacterium]|nr:ACT domain-containing protein [Planctomycetota bacterium]
MKQITIVVDDRPGVLASICSVLACRHINIEGIEAEGVDDHGVISLSVDHYEDALHALTNAGFQVISEDALIIKLSDEPGALAGIAKRFSKAKINIRSMRIVRRDDGITLIALVTERCDKSKELLEDVLIT